MERGCSVAEEVGMVQIQAGSRTPRFRRRRPGDLGLGEQVGRGMVRNSGKTREKRGRRCEWACFLVVVVVTRLLLFLDLYVR